jgi:hypothetical protein
LVNTGSATLIENVRTSSFWGNGSDEQGTNMMGKLLEELRESLKTEGHTDTSSKPALETYNRSESQNPHQQKWQQKRKVSQPREPRETHHQHYGNRNHDRRRNHHQQQKWQWKGTDDRMRQKSPDYSRNRGKSSYSNYDGSAYNNFHVESQEYRPSSPSQQNDWWYEHEYNY